MMRTSGLRRRHVGAPPVKRIRRGQSIVELALALPLLLLLLLGTIDIGRVFFDYVQLRNAAREGAGYGAHFPTDEVGIEARVMRHGVPSGTSVDAVPNSCAINGGVVTGTCTITVTVQNTFTPITLGFLQNWFGMQPFSLSASATMRVLQ